MTRFGINARRSILQAEVTRRRNYLTIQIMPYDRRNGELTLGIISDENKAALILPMNYINVLKSLDLTGVSDEATFHSNQVAFITTE